MNRYPDLVQGTKLDTSFDNDYTVHEHDDSEDEQRLSRPARRVEYWATEKALAEGGFGEIFLQRCIRGGGRRQVEWRAVKMVSKRKSRAKKIDYVTELEAIAKFSQKRYSKCFVKLLGWYDTNDHLFIAMEYFPLGDLQRYMSESQPLPETDAQHISYQVLEGLNYMHSEDFAHRDIKPANILIKSRPPDGSWWIKLSDFGISKRFDPSAEQVYTIKGTVAYMAPELVCHDTRLPLVINHQAADMWSVGEMVFRMLSKTAAFPSLHALLSYHVRPDFFPSKPLERIGASKQTLDFIQSLMRPAPEARLTSSQALDHAWLRSLRRSATVILPMVSQSGSITPAPPMTSELSSGVGQWATVTSTGMSISRAIPSASELSRPTTDPLTARAALAILAIESRHGLEPPPALRPPTRLRSKDKAPAMESPSSVSLASSHRGFDPVLVSPPRTTNQRSKVRAPPTESHSGDPLATPHTGLDPPVTMRPNGSKIWDRDVFAPTPVQMLKGHGNIVNSVVFSPDDQQLISGSTDSTAKVWDRNSRKCIATLEGHLSTLTSVAVSPDGKQVISGSYDSTAKAWDQHSGKCVATFKDHRGPITSVAVSPDGQQFFSGSFDSTVKVWDRNSGKCIAALQGHGGKVASTAISPDTRYFISGSYGGTVNIWSCGHFRDSPGLAPQSRFRQIASRVFPAYPTIPCDATIKSYDHGFVASVAFAPEGQQFAMSSEISGTIKVWDLNSQTFLQKLQHDGIIGCINSVIFSPDGQKIISARTNGGIKVWDRRSDRCIQTLQPNKLTGVWALAISSDSRHIASGMDDGTIMIWDYRSPARPY